MNDYITSTHIVYNEITIPYSASIQVEGKLTSNRKIGIGIKFNKTVWLLNIQKFRKLERENLCHLN